MQYASFSSFRLWVFFAIDIFQTTPERLLRGADSTNGHVGFVERVERQSNGTYKVIYTDNSHTDPANPAEMIETPGEGGLSFIYDQKAAM
ncbi:MAG: hypothetical protein HS099_28545 [Ardenticatenaceae bacterium]|nr:hypothetical protein [Ardenticatenaceae bacterium]